MFTANDARKLAGNGKRQNMTTILEIESTDTKRVKEKE